jgi:hypothetical protein
VNAVLSDTVDTRKSKPGDTVKAKTSEDVKTAGVIVIPHGTRLVGHVTEAQAAAKSDVPARLGIVFDRADLKDGRQIPLHTALYALAAPEGASDDRNSSSDKGFSGGLGTGSTGLGDMVNASARRPSDDSSGLGASDTRRSDLKPSPGAIGGLNGGGRLYASSRGVFGLEELSLEPSTVPSAGSSVILANARGVHLAGGTRMLLALAEAR